MIYIISGGVIGFSILLYCWSIHNSLVKHKNIVNEAWSDIVVALNRRHQLISVVFAATNTLSRYEQFVQTSQTAVRENAIEKLSENEKALESSLVAVVESMPNVVVTENFQQLFTQLVDVENDIQANRLLYNRSVALYHRFIESFPANIFINLFGYGKIDFFALNSDMSQKLRGVRSHVVQPTKLQ